MISMNNGPRSYIAISPSGKEIVTLDCDTHTLKTYRRINEKEVIFKFECKLRFDIGIETEKFRWSLAISDADDPDGNTLIALSCLNFDRNDDSNANIKIIIDNVNALNSIQMCSTRVISTSGNKVWHKMENFYGFLQL